MPPEPSPPDPGIAALVARAVGHGNAAYLGDNKAEQLCSWLFDALSQIYWLHDPANPDADTDAVPAGRVRVITLAGTWEDVGTHSHMIQTRISAIDALTPLTPVDGRAPVPESGDFVVFVQVTDRSRVVLSTSLVMPRDPCVLFGTAWEQMCELFPEGEPQRAMVPAFTTTLPACRACARRQDARPRARCAAPAAACSGSAAASAKLGPGPRTRRPARG